MVVAVSIVLYYTYEINQPLPNDVAHKHKEIKWALIYIHYTKQWLGGQANGKWSHGQQQGPLILPDNSKLKQNP